MVETVAPEQVGVVTRDIACQLLMLTHQRLDQLVADGWIKKIERGHYRIIDVVQGYIRFLREANKRDVAKAADNRVRDARVHEIEIRTAARLGRLVRREDAIAVCDDVVGFTRVEISGISRRCSRDLNIRKAIDNEVNAALTRIADRLQDKTTELGADAKPN